MIMDRAFDKDGAFSYPATDPSLASMPGVKDKYMNGVTGDVILVNGAAWPALEVDAARYRFRILNASNARPYELALDNGAGFTQIGSDQGLLAAPVTHSTLPIAPAERFDVIVDFSQFPVGTQVTLINKLGSGGTAQIMRFTVARKATDDSSIPATLSTVDALPTTGSTRRRDWMFKKGKVHGMGMEMDGWVINNREFDPQRDDADPRLGDVEIWRIGSDAYHPVHIHHSAFQVVSRNGGAPDAADAGWKDTVSISPKQFVEVAVRFTDYPGRFLVHCHNLEHEDMAMMAAFKVS
jgi:spore coat protein A